MKLAFTGFYQQSNLGDDAFVSVLADHFPNAKFTPGKFDGDETHVVVGGGEFEPWMVKDAPTHAKLYAIGIGLVRDAVGPERATWLKRCQYVAVRDPASYRLARLWDVPARQGADLAFLLRPSPVPCLRQRRLIVVPRLNTDPWPIVLRLTSEQRYSDVAFMPFHPQDDITDVRCYRVVHIDDPRQALNFIAGAQLLVCWGKLHAKVFAASAGTEYVDAAPDVKGMALAEQLLDSDPAHQRGVASGMIMTLKTLLETP